MTSPGPAPYTREGGVTDDGLNMWSCIHREKKNPIYFDLI